MKPSELVSVLENLIQTSMPVMITGAPGIGKTDIVYQVAQKADADMIVMHPVVSDPTDFKGFPFPFKKAPDSVPDHAEFLPFGDLCALIEAKKPTICFIDDLGQSSAAVQASAMQLILARRVNGHRVSDHVVFIAATNRKQDKAGVTGILEPVKSRFATIVELEPDLNDWVAWALKDNMPTELIAFIRFRPNLLFDFKPTLDMTNSPCPRTVANVGRLMQLNLPQETEYEVYSGAAGEAFAAELMAFLKIFRDLPNPDVVLMDPQNADVPTDPATLYALSGALSNRASERTIGRLCEYANRLPPEFSVLTINDARRIAPEITTTRPFIEWGSKHSDLLL